MERFKMRTFPLMKCGAVPIAASAFGALANIYSSNGANRMQQENIDMQREENQKNRDFQAEQAELARQFTTDERIAQQLYQSQQWQHQFDEETRVQSPAYQAGQLQAAGINPAVYFSRSSAFQGGQSPSVSAPSGAQSPLPQGSSGLSSIAPIVPQFPQLISSAADLLGSIATAKKAGAEVDNLNAGTELIWQQVLGQELANQYKEFENQMAKEKIPAEIRKLIQEEKTLSSVQALNEAQGSKFQKEKELMDTQMALNKALENYHGKNAEWLNQQIIDLRATRDARISALRASAEESRASAEESRASAANINFFNRLREEPAVRESLITEAKEAGKAAVNANKISEKQAKQLDYLISQAAYADDNKEFTYWSNQITNLVGTLGEAASQFYGAGALRELIKVRQTQQKPHMSVQGF